MLQLADATIGILTVLPHELAAVRTVLGCPDSAVAIASGKRSYQLVRVTATRTEGEHVVAVGTTSDMGNNPATIAATHLAEDCPGLRCMILVGIAAAVPNPTSAERHVRLGDIVVPDNTGVVKYDFGTQKEHGFVTRPRPFAPDIALLQVAKSLLAMELEGKRPWCTYIEETQRKLGAQWARPDPTTDQLRDTLSKAVIEHPEDPDRIAGVPRVFQGTIGSADRVQRNQTDRDKLREEFGLLAIEMESAGFALAAFEAGRPFFVVRGACDYANSDKNNTWHKYAALVAAAYTRALIEHLPVCKTPNAATQVVSFVGLQSPATPATEMPVIATGFAGVSASAVAESITPYVPSPTTDSAHPINQITHAGPSETTTAAHADRIALVTLEATRRMQTIQSHLAGLDIDSAFALVDSAADWLLAHDTTLPRTQVSDFWFLLADVSSRRESRALAQGASANLTQARLYLERARPQKHD